MTLADTAAAVISYAREFSGLTNAEFDYRIATRGIGGPNSELGSATYVIATRDVPDAMSTDDREALWLRTWEALAPEMQAYERRCRDRRYSGWSNASRGPIRYAS